MIRSRDSGDDGGARGRAEKFEESEKVEANYKGKGKYCPGKISRCQVTGTYDINYDDGEQESGVEAKMIRSRDVVSLLSDDGGGGGQGRAEKFEESDKVEETKISPHPAPHGPPSGLLESAGDDPGGPS
jgi:hypothetical protein